MTDKEKNIEIIYSAITKYSEISKRYGGLSCNNLNEITKLPLIKIQLYLKELEKQKRVTHYEDKREKRCIKRYIIIDK